MLTFAGAGYSRNFVANFRTIVARIQAGAPIVLVEGPDDVCAGLVKDPEAGHCSNGSVTLRDVAAREALAGVGGLSGQREPDAAFVLEAPLVAELRALFASGTIRAACVGCEWSPLCDRIAVDGFLGTVLQAPLPP